MARIRSIKPEFWSSAQVMECSPNARLFFIGLWNFCDDHGRHPTSERQHKALIFPGDEFSLATIRGMIDELAENDLVQVYTVDNKEYLHVTGWAHQKIDKPQKAKFPPPPQSKPQPFGEPSPNVRDGEEYREGRKGEDLEEKESNPHQESSAAREAEKPERPKDESLIARCRDLVGMEPVKLAQDFIELEKIAETEGWLEEDFIDGIGTALRRGAQRFKAWISFENWIRNSAKARLARIPRAAQPPGKSNGHANGAATPDDPIIDLGPVKDIQSRLVNAIQKIRWPGYAGWAETEFGSVEYFRSAVAARAPHLMKFWPAPPATDPAEPALAVAK